VLIQHSVTGTYSADITFSNWYVPCCYNFQ